MRKNKQKPQRRTMIGGQALMEGVMMRGKTAMAIAVRAPDGQIELETERIKPPKKILRVPVIRGVAAFVTSLSLGMTCLLKSARISTPEEDTPSKGVMAIAMVIGVALAIGIFILLPSFISSAIQKYAHITNIAYISLIEGGLRLVIFILYLLLTSLLKDIRRTFMYHGAEHRTINCYEKGLELNIKNIQSCSTRHNRCGTTFLFFVIILSILIFALTNWLFSFFTDYQHIFQNAFMRAAIRLALLPLIAGLSYELLRALALLPDNIVTDILRAPGLALQRLTTYPPENDMAEVALVAFNAVLGMDENPKISEIKFYERKLKDVHLQLKHMLTREPADADWILCSILNIKRHELEQNRIITYADAQKAVEYAKRRLEGEPLDYILGQSEFCGYKLAVDKRVLIPRFETEVLAKTAIIILGNSPKTVLDLCTGSGCIAYVICNQTQSRVTAADISADALSVCRENLKGLNCEIIESDMFANIQGSFDLIVCNPPYIKSADIDGLAPEVKCQPLLALDGGTDGLEFYKNIAQNARAHLNAGGTMLLEVGYDQSREVCGMFSHYGAVNVIDDFDGKQRIIRIDVNGI